MQGVTESVSVGGLINIGFNMWQIYTNYCSFFALGIHKKREM